MDLIDRDAFSEEMKKRQDACIDWMHEATDSADEESYLRATAAYAMLSEIALTLKKQPSIETICGFKIDDLVILAEVCRRNGITEVDMKTMRTITKYVVNAVRAEMEEITKELIKSYFGEKEKDDE